MSGQTVDRKRVAMTDAPVPQAHDTISREVTYTIALRFGDTWVPQKFGADYAPLTAEAAIERAAKYATERPHLGPTLAVRVETVVTALDRRAGDAVTTTNPKMVVLSRELVSARQLIAVVGFIVQRKVRGKVRDELVDTVNKALVAIERAEAVVAK